MRIEKLKIGIILVSVYAVAAATIYFTSYSCDWQHSLCNQGLETASFPSSLIFSPLVYFILKSVGHLEAVLKSHLILYYIFYPSFVLNLLVFYGLGGIISEFVSEQAWQQEREHPFNKSNKPTAKSQILGVLLIILAALLLSAAWQLLQHLLHR